MNKERRAGVRIGVLIPFTNTNLEPDMVQMCPPDASVHFQRMGGYDVDEIPDSDQMATMGATDIGHDIRMIAGVRPDIVLYGCTSATLTHGAGFDADLAGQIRAGSGAVTLTAAGSLAAAITAAGISKVGFSSPYVGEINGQAVGFLSEHGIDTVKRADIGRELGNYGQGELTPDEICELACQADHPDAQAIVLSCTDLRAVEAIPQIEATLDKPVISSNQAMVFCLMRELGLPRHRNLPGRLFDLL